MYYNLLIHAFKVAPLTGSGGPARPERAARSPPSEARKGGPRAAEFTARPRAVFRGKPSAAPIAEGRHAQDGEQDGGYADTSGVW